MVDIDDLTPFGLVEVAASHLRVALLQTVPSDDQIIIQHVRDALGLLERFKEESA